jgi:DNA-binding NarL/FixJ family response regulator
MAPLRVLLVDDTPAFTQALQRYLRDPQLEVVGVATSGREALREISRLQPDLVLMDIVMPDMNGLEATRLIKTRPSPPRVIILTLYDQSEYRAEAVRAGAEVLISKTSLHQELWPAINALFAVLDPAAGRT